MDETYTNPPEQNLSDAIGRQRRMFSAMRTKNLSSYLERQKQPSLTPTLVILNGWNDLHFTTQDERAVYHHLLKNDNEMALRSGGYWVKVGEIGIAINPGKNFLERLHAAGLHLWDIDHVIVTEGHPGASSDIERLWSFNREINSLLKEWKLTPHIISYWLHPKAFERSSSVLRPTFREERSSVQRLEAFPDISSLETIDLNQKVALDFCPSRQADTTNSSFMIRIRAPEATVGFLSQSPFESHQVDFFSTCSTLILGIGNTSFEEITGVTPNTTTLGCTGALTIIKGSSAHLVIISEQGFSEGDIRIEALKHMRKEIPPTCSPIILPAEEGLCCFLDSMSLTAPGLKTPTAITAVRAMRSDGPFSRLTFLDEESIL